jgi:glycosyltransferase involved in cell wall biosynthesis
MSTAPVLGMLVKVWPKLSETFILEEVLGLERRGVALRLYALAPPSDEISHPAVANVKASLACVPALTWRHLPTLLAAQVDQALRRPGAWARAVSIALGRGRAGIADLLRAGWLAARLRADGVDHLHAHFIAGPADVAQLAAAIAARPFSISAHAKDIYTSQPDDLARRLRAASFTVTCTEFNRRTLAAIAPDAPVHRMYHGIDHGLFHPRRRSAPGAVPLVLAVGRLRAKKGLDTLIDACAALRDRGRRFRCEIVGYGEERDALRRRIDAASLGGHVHLLGKLAREQVIDRYARASVFVQPSRVTADGDRDGIPNVLLEAMAIGLPVVGSNVSGIPELIEHDHNGLLVEADDAAALAAAIERLIDAPDEAARLGSAARATVTAGFDNDRNLQVLLHLLGNPHDCHAHACAA